MIKVFSGDDRTRAQKEITKFLGPDYEIIEGPDVAPGDLPTIFRGNSLFGSTRHILLRDFFTNSAALPLLVEYLDTPHQVAFLETKLDKRSAIYKTLVAASKKSHPLVEFYEFKLPEPDKWISFEIYRLAKTDGSRAVAKFQEHEATIDPHLFLGAMASQAMKDYAARSGSREKRVLQELSKLDQDLRTFPADRSALILKAFLLRLSSI